MGTLLPGIEFEPLNGSSGSRNYFCLYIYLAYEYRAGAVQYNYAIGGQKSILLDLYLEELLVSGIPDHVTSARAGTVRGLPQNER